MNKSLAHLNDDDRELLVFPNGARLVLDPMPHVRTASVGVWINAGARDETKNNNGIAHLLEHMAFKGAGGLGALELVQSVEDRGAILNASTSYERTGFYIRSLADDAANMIGIAAGLALDQHLPQDELDRERGVVLQEIGEAADQAEDLVFELAQSASWPNHAVGRSVLGTEDTLADIGIAQLKGFVEEHYVSNRIVMSVAGGFDREEIIAQAEKWLLPLKAGEEPNRVTPKSGQGAMVRERDTEQAHLVLSMSAPNSLTNDRFAARLFEEIFGGGMSSRLYQEVREKRGLAYTIDAEFDSYQDTGRFNVYCGCDPADASDVQKIVKDMWFEFAEKGPTQAEMKRAIAVQKAQFAMSSEGPAARASSGAYELFTFNRLLNLSEVLQQIDQVTLEDVQACVQSSVNDSRTASCVGPAEALDAAFEFSGD